MDFGIHFTSSQTAVLILSLMMVCYIFSIFSRLVDFVNMLFIHGLAGPFFDAWLLFDIFSASILRLLFKHIFWQVFWINFESFYHILLICFAFIICLWVVDAVFGRCWSNIHNPRGIQEESRTSLFRYFFDLGFGIDFGSMVDGFWAHFGFMFDDFSNTFRINKRHFSTFLDDVPRNDFVKGFVWYYPNVSDIFVFLYSEKIIKQLERP